MAKYKSRAVRCGEAADSLTEAGELCQKVCDALEEADDAQRRELWPSVKEHAEKAIDLITDGRTDLEYLKEEMEAWRDSIPENLQGGNKYEEVSAAVDALESAIDALTEEFPEIEFDPASSDFDSNIEDVLQALSTIVDELDDAASQANDVEFPGMMG